MHQMLEDLHETIADLEERILSSLSRNDPSLEDVRDRAKAGARHIRDEILAAAEAGQSPALRVARNLVATAEPDNLRRLEVLLRYWVEEDPVEPIAGFRALSRAAGLERRRADMLRWLLLGGRRPGLSVATAFFAWRLDALLAFERGTPESTIAPGGRRTRRLLAAAFRGRPKSLDASARRAFLEQGFAKGLPSLDEPDFESLPRGIRKWILADRSFSEAALAPALARAIWSHPLRHPDTPEALAEERWLRSGLPEACASLRARRFRAPKVVELLGRPDLDSCAGRILPALQKRSSWVYGPETLPARSATLRGLANVRLRNALAFFSLRPERRLAVIDKLEDPAVRDLAGDASAEDWTDAIRFSRSPGRLERALESPLLDGAARRRLAQMLPATSSTDQCRAAFVRHWRKNGDAASMIRLAARLPETLALWRPGDLEFPELRQHIERLMATGPGLATLVKEVRPSVLGALLSSAEPWDSWVAAWDDSLVGSGRKGLSRETRLCRLSLAIEHCPGGLFPGGDEGSWRITPEEFRTLVRWALSRPPAGWQARLFNIPNREGEPAWEGFAGPGGEWKALRRLLRVRRPDLVGRLEEVEIGRLLANDRFKEKLRRVLEGASPARTLRLPQEKLRRFIPWVREEWKTRPTLAVAYEIALAFSIHDVRYLVALCVQRWKSRPLDKEGRVFDHLYHTYPLPKRSGGKRIVTVPDNRLKRLQRNLLRRGFDELIPHDAAHGFRRGRSILTNAEIHVGQPCVVNVDIKSFFPNTRYRHVLSACWRLLDGSLSAAARRVIADICCYDGGLPTGAPTSPAIANLVLQSTDVSVAKASEASGVKYTRYADDLTFSGGSNAVRIIPFATRALGELGYELDAKKTNIFRRGRRQIVTGLVVNEKPNLPRRLRRRLRAAAHALANNREPHWHGRPMSANELSGRLALLQMLQPAEARRLREQIAARWSDDSGGGR